MLGSISWVWTGSIVLEFWLILRYFLVYLLSGLVKCFLVARHLLAKIGTDVAILIYKSSLLWMDHILKWCCPFFSADSFIKRYSH
jgi:hypothetical protein